ncbi:MAG TPA: hypothetical protein VF286_03930 [Acidiphilium sp.]
MTRTRAGALAVFALTAASVLAGCAAMGPSPIEQAAKTMVGQPVDVAFRSFGPPSVSNPPSQIFQSGGTYFWNDTSIAVDPNLSFIQTGSQYAGSHIAGMTPGGNGVAAMPMYQDDYQPTGYYGHQTALKYLCSIIVNTDTRNVITKATVIGCSNRSDGL